MKLNLKNNVKSLINKCRSKPLMCMLVLVLLVTVVLVALKMTNNLPKPSPNTFANIETFQDATEITSEDQLLPSDDEVIVALFYTNWCGHCKAFKPSFLEMMKKSGSINSERSEGHVTLKMVDCEANPDLCKKYEIAGYPTIKTFRPSTKESNPTGDEDVVTRSNFSVDTLKSLSL
jgi:thiol-disulfide isomerase/thioredoxin